MTQATYHGITYAKCHVCGYESSDETTLEAWNDYGSQCPKAPEGDSHGPGTATEWHMLDGTRAFTIATAEYGEFLHVKEA